jgi:hypothetical protein
MTPEDPQPPQKELEEPIQEVWKTISIENLIQGIPMLLLLMLPLSHLLMKKQQKVLSKIRKYNKRLRH